MQGSTTRFLIASMLLSLSATAQAAVVAFSNIVSGDGAPTFFDESTTTPDAVNGNVLNIGLNNFGADGASSSNTAAVDALSLVITAPEGYMITSLLYSEAGQAETTGGTAVASGSIVADGMPTNFATQVFAPGTTLSAWSIEPGFITIDNKQSIAVSVTNSLFAYAFGPTDIAMIEKTSATLTVGLTQVPLPAAAWLFGSAIAGLIYSKSRLT
ncbi:hypothetical protein N8793_03235 [Pseudomonadales bacterium]|nr:hypothetical protein [Pseudomonadales bacterium]